MNWYNPPRPGDGFARFICKIMRHLKKKLFCKLMLVSLQNYRVISHVHSFSVFTV